MYTTNSRQNEASAHGVTDDIRVIFIRDEILSGCEIEVFMKEVNSGVHLQGRAETQSAEMKGDHPERENSKKESVKVEGSFGSCRWSVSPASWAHTDTGLEC